MQGGAPETTGWLEGLSYRKYMCKYRDRLPSRPPTRHPETDEAGHGGGTAGGDWQLVTPPSPRPVSVKNERAGASPVHSAGGSPVGVVLLGSRRWEAEGGRLAHGDAEGKVELSPARRSVSPAGIPAFPLHGHLSLPLETGSRQSWARPPAPVLRAAPSLSTVLVYQRLFDGCRFSASCHHCMRVVLTPVRAGGAWPVSGTSQNVAQDLVHELPSDVCQRHNLNIN